MKEPREIRRALNRLTEGELRKLCSRWNVPLLDETPKHAILQNLLDGRLQSGLMHRDHAEMDLTHCIAQPNERMWFSCRLSGMEESKEKAFKPQDFEMALNQQLSMYFKQFTAVRIVRGVCYVRIGIETERWQESGHMQVIFVVHHIRSAFVFHSQVQKAHSPYILGALRSALHCREVRPFDLKGKDLESLARLCLERQGRYSAASLGALAGGVRNPLDTAEPQISSTLKRQQEDPDEEACGDFVDEDRVTKKTRRTALQDTFGVASEAPPVLQSLEFKVGGQFKGSLEIAGPFHMNVKFEGTNVLGGFRELAEHGLAELPYPDHIANLAETAQSKIEVEGE